MAEQFIKFVKIGKVHFNLGAIPCIEEGEEDVTVYLGGDKTLVLSGNDAEALLFGIESEDLLRKLEIAEISRLSETTGEDPSAE
jgi:hypothetical protein